MAASIKAVSDAIISRLASAVEGLNPQTVAAFAGSLGEFVESGRNLPFVGVALVEVRYAGLNSDGSLAEEHLSFRLTAVAEDFRGRQFSLENTYGLLDGVRQALLGHSLGIPGLSPLAVKSCARDEEAEKQGLAVFRMELAAWQVRQQ